MDDPMIRPRLDRITERDLWGFPIPSENPLLFLPQVTRARFSQSSITHGGTRARTEQVQFDAQS